jgi:hypothetical protein
MRRLGDLLKMGPGMSLAAFFMEYAGPSKPDPVVQPAVEPAARKMIPIAASCERDLQFLRLLP